MTAQIFESSPNFVGAGDMQRDLRARDVLSDQFEMHGLVTRDVEEHLATNWEQAHGRAILRTWEEAGDRTAYVERSRNFVTPLAKKLDMDPDLAREEIDRLMRSEQPEIHATRINELRTEVLGEPAISFEGVSSAAAPVVAGAPDQPPPAPLSAFEKKLATFFRMHWRDQKIAMQDEKDVEFLTAVRKGPPGTIPIIRTLAGKRIKALEEGE